MTSVVEHSVTLAEVRQQIVACDRCPWLRTYTRRLTPSMMDAVFQEVAKRLRSGHLPRA